MKIEAPISLHQPWGSFIASVQEKEAALKNGPVSSSEVQLIGCQELLQNLAADLFLLLRMLKLKWGRLTMCPSQRHLLTATTGIPIEKQLRREAGSVYSILNLTILVHVQGCNENTQNRSRYK